MKDMESMHNDSMTNERCTASNCRQERDFGSERVSMRLEAHCAPRRASSVLIFDRRSLYMLMRRSVSARKDSMTNGAVRHRIVSAATRFWVGTSFDAVGGALRTKESIERADIR